MSDAPFPVSPDDLLSHAQFVRKLARCLVADRDAADDLAQDTWLAALDRPPRSGHKLRSWLATIARNLLRSRVRSERQRRFRERAAALREALPSAAELADGIEVHQRVVAAVLELAEPYRSTILWRFFADRSPREIARRESIPVETVRTHVKRGIAQLRLALDERCGGGAREWRAALLPIALAMRSVPIAGSATAAATHTLGALLMSAKTKLLAAVLVVAAVTIATWKIANGPVSQQTSSPVATAPSPVAVGESEVASTGAGIAQREPIASAPSPRAGDPGSTGSVHVRATWEKDRSPAAGVWIRLAPASDVSPPPWDRRLVTDADGSCRFDGIEAGKLSVRSDRGTVGAVQVTSGQRADVELALPTAITIDGVVVDERDRPVAGAEVWLSDVGNDLDGQVVTLADHEGKFHLRDLPRWANLGARAPGYSPSLLHFLTGNLDTRVVKTLVLRGVGGEIVGRVFDAGGAPVVGARLAAGPAGDHSVQTGQNLADGTQVQEPTCFRAMTDAEGRFHIRGLGIGAFIIACRAERCAPARVEAQVQPNVATEVEIHLGEPAAVVGTVRNAAGEPEVGVEVSSGARGDFLRTVTKTDQDGAFALGDLAPGEIALDASAGKRGTAKGSVIAAAAEEAEWHAVLSSGLEITGRVLDARDTPLVRWRIQASPAVFDPRNMHSSSAETDAFGRFTLKSLRQQQYVVEVSGPEAWCPSAVRKLEPSAEAVLFRISDQDLPSARLIGKIADAEGHPLGGISVIPIRSGRRNHPSVMSKENTGEFEMGPLPAGPYRLLFVGKAQVLFEIEGEVAPGSTWDLGQVRIPRTGSLLARLQSDGDGDVAAARPALQIVRVREPRFGLPSDLLKVAGDAARAAALAPGEYVLEVAGDGVARAQHRFDVRAGEETTIDVPLRAGAAQKISCVCARQPAPAGVRIVVRNDAGIALVDDWFLIEQGRVELTVTLSPGSFEAEASTGDGARTKLAFTVASVAEPAAPIELIVR